MRVVSRVTFLTNLNSSMSVKGKISIAVFVAAAFVAGIFFATAGANLFDFGDRVGTTSTAAPRSAGTTALSADQVDPKMASLEDAFTNVAESVNPAVVQIQAAKVVDRRRRNPFSGTPFEDFFGGPSGPDQELRQGLGSGVILRSDGYIATNNHVVEDADQLSVRMFDGTTYDADIVGTDPFSDLAVIKIDPDEELPSISFSDSENVKAGQWVLAFGSPLSQDLSNSVTAGIVSAVGRLQQAPQRRRMRQQPQDQQLSQVQNFIQTDAAINPGNSGGPLVDLRGRLVGINTAIVSQTGGYQGIGFAIPANEVDRVTSQLIETGEVKRAFLGISYQPASESLIENEDLPRGASVVADVRDGSPADEADLQPGDIVVAIDGQTLTESLQVTNLIASKQPGEQIQITVNRGGEQQTLTATLGSRDASGRTTASADGDSAPSEMMENLGMQLQNVTPELARRLGLDEAEGVIITELDRSNPMIADSGLQPNMIITRMAGRSVSSVSDVQEIYDSLNAGEAFRVVVRTPQGMAYVSSLRKPSDDG